VFGRRCGGAPKDGKLVSVAFGVSDTGGANAFARSSVYSPIPPLPYTLSHVGAGDGPESAPYRQRHQCSSSLQFVSTRVAPVLQSHFINTSRSHLWAARRKLFELCDAHLSSVRNGP
jgi:hypothetical protein